MLAEMEKRINELKATIDLPGSDREAILIEIRRLELESLRRSFLQLPSARVKQCPECGLSGPEVNTDCFSMNSHDDEMSVNEDGTVNRRNNSCKACGWYSNNWSDWAPWDGKFAEEKEGYGQPIVPTARAVEAAQQRQTRIEENRASRARDQGISVDEWLRRAIERAPRVRSAADAAVPAPGRGAGIPPPIERMPHFVGAPRQNADILSRMVERMSRLRSLSEPRDDSDFEDSDEEDRMRMLRQERFGMEPPAVLTPTTRAEREFRSIILAVLRRRRQ